MPRFSTDIEWVVQPGRKIDVTLDDDEPLRSRDCNALTLQRCKLDDDSALVGCNELDVRCQHFEQDAVHTDSTGKSRTVPANATPNDGYAMALDARTLGCNAYHGDLTLVSLDQHEERYALLCVCKNPGYIGNDSVLGQCDRVRICDGLVDSVDQPLERLKCRCDKSQYSVRYEDGLPMCRSMTVLEANNRHEDWTDLVPWASHRLAPIERFNPTVRDNLHARLLLDPCRNALDEPRREILGGAYNSLLRTCRFRNYGLPVVNGLLAEPIDRATIKSDADVCRADGALATDKYEAYRFTDNVSGERRIGALVARLLPHMSYMANAPVLALPRGLGYGKQVQIFLDARRREFVGPRCQGNWPHGKYCTYEFYWGGTDNGVPYSSYRHSPFMMEEAGWMAVEASTLRGIVRDHQRGLWISTKELNRVPAMRAYGFQIAARHAHRLTGLAVMPDERGYQVHTHSLTYAVDAAAAKDGKRSANLKALKTAASFVLPFPLPTSTEGTATLQALLPFPLPKKST